MRSSYVFAGLAGVFLIAVAVTAVIASSPEAWSAHEKEVREACTGASGLDQATPKGSVIVFGDEVGYDALIIEGVYPQPHMNGAHGAMLCLYNRAAKAVVVSEMKTDG